MAKNKHEDSFLPWLVIIFLFVLVLLKGKDGLYIFIFLLCIFWIYSSIKSLLLNKNKNKNVSFYISNHAIVLYFILYILIFLIGTYNKIKINPLYYLTNISVFGFLFLTSLEIIQCRALVPFRGGSMMEKPLIKGRAAIIWGLCQVILCIGLLIGFIIM